MTTAELIDVYGDYEISYPQMLSPGFDPRDVRSRDVRNAHDNFHA